MFRLVFLIIASLASLPVNATERLLVFAAASQRDVMETLGSAYEKQCDCELVFSFASTAVLARQIDAGADAKVFVSANEAWIDWLQERGKIGEANRKVIAGNELVIASAARTKDSFNILMRERFSMADPQSVPAGIYAQQALRNMGIWDKVGTNAVYAENVRLALYSVRRGDLLSGIVYRSDLHNTPGLHAHYVFPGNVHDPIRYVAVLLEPSAIAKGFLEFLESGQAKQTFADFGFSPIPVSK